MSEERNEFYNRLSSLFEENKLTIPDSVFVNPRYKRTMDSVASFGIDPASEGDTTILGMKVHYSSFVEEGTAYIVNNPRRFGYGRAPLPAIEADVHESIRKHFQNFFDRTILGGIGGWEQKREYNWHQFPDESLLAWGDRLFERGLLDNPAIRWEYQKVVLGAPFKALKAIWLRVAS